MKYLLSHLIPLVSNFSPSPTSSEAKLSHSQTPARSFPPTFFLFFRPHGCEK